MKKIILCLLFLLISNSANAQIITRQNHFNNSKEIISVNNELKGRFPKSIILIKKISNITTYKMIIQNDNSLSNLFANTDNIEIKTYNDHIYNLPTRIGRLGYDRNVATVELNSDILLDLQTIKSMEIQIPVIENQSKPVPIYYYISLDNSIIDEFKKVISMQ